MTKKIFITGGAGFIGSHLADYLLIRGDEVLVLDNYQTGRRDNLAPHKNLSVVEGSVTDEMLVTRLVNNFKPDIMVHAAASYKDPSNWQEDCKTNALGTAIVVKASEGKVSRFIYFQTALCYGLRPIEQPITLDHPILPRGSSYAISKTVGEDYVHLSSLDFISFRLANAYGPRNMSGPLPTFYQRLTNKQKCFVMDTRRDFIYISDMIDCIIMALDGKGKKGVYHISSGTDFAIKELFDHTVKALNLSVEADVMSRKSDDVFSILLDPSKTKLDFGWIATTSLSHGVSKSIEYYRKYGIEETYTHLKQDDK